MGATDAVSGSLLQHVLKFKTYISCDAAVPPWKIYVTDIVIHKCKDMCEEMAYKVRIKLKATQRQ